MHFVIRDWQFWNIHVTLTTEREGLSSRGTARLVYIRTYLRPPRFVYDRCTRTTMLLLSCSARRQGVALSAVLDALHSWSTFLCRTCVTTELVPLLRWISTRIACAGRWRAERTAYCEKRSKTFHLVIKDRHVLQKCSCVHPCSLHIYVPLK